MCGLYLHPYYDKRGWALVYDYCWISRTSLWTFSKPLSFLKSIWSLAADCLSSFSNSPSLSLSLQTKDTDYVMSTGGAAMNAIMNTLVAVKSVGIIRTPNQPMYKRFSVLVTHSQKRAHRLPFSRLSKIAVIISYYLWIFLYLVCYCW